MANEYRRYIYSAAWRIRSKRVQNITKNHCIVFPWLKSNHAHHLTYRNLQNEIPGRDIVPLSKFAHSIIHWKIFWKIPKMRVLINHLLRLLFGFWSVFWFLFGKKNENRKRQKNR